MTAGNRSAHPERDITVVDPYTFGFLFRQANGGSNASRASWMDDTIPRSATLGESVAAKVTVRNDGWDTWAATSSASS